MHTSVIRSPQAMSNDQSYRPRSPDLPAHTNPQNRQPLPRLTRLPSYQIQEPALPKGYSFSPRGSYDASPFFSQALQQLSNPDSSFQQADSQPQQSPPRFAPASLPDQQRVFSPVSYTEPSQHQQPASSLSKSPFDVSQHLHYSGQPYQPSIDEMARLRSRKAVNYNEDHQAPQYEEPMPTYQQPPSMHQMPPQQQQQQQQHFAQYPPPSQSFPQPMPMMQQHVHIPTQQTIQPTAPSMSHIDVKTKFPVARIKRIMQSDEDVGKVAQATPTAVSKALELFMIALVSKGAAEAKNNSSSKRVTATHLKHALLTDPQFDFLNEICEAVPDEGGKGSKARAKSDDSDEDMGGVSKKKGKGGKKKRTDDDGSD